MKHQQFAAFVFAAALALATEARAQTFAEPPDEPVAADPLAVARHEDDTGIENGVAEEDSSFGAPASAVRLHVGPALRLSELDPQGGLFGAIDVGKRSAGARFSGSFLRVGSEHGLSQYNAELWIDFARHERLHPIVGAGAGIARVQHRTTGSEDIETSTIGVGSLRASLEYGLAVPATDARASLSVIGNVPAIRSNDAISDAPWLLVVASVGVGF
jgi:hypothetical protein